MFRYQYGGKPLWLQPPAGANVHDDVIPPPCQQCGSERVFELQLMPALVYYLKTSSDSGENKVNIWYRYCMLCMLCNNQFTCALRCAVQHIVIIVVSWYVDCVFCQSALLSSAVSSCTRAAPVAGRWKQLSWTSTLYCRLSQNCRLLRLQCSDNP